MKTLILLQVAVVAWVSCKASVADTGGLLGYEERNFKIYKHHALISHSFLQESGRARIQCILLCLRHTHCLSVNHDSISGICQLNDGSKEEFPESYKQDDGFSYFGGSSNEAEPLTEVTMITTETQQETSQAQATTQIATLSTPIPDATSAKAVDAVGLTVICPQGVFGLTNDSYTRTSVQWLKVYVNDQIEDYKITCSDDEEGRTVVSGDFFKVGTTTVTCVARDAADNSGQCTFLVTISVCNMTRLGMESGAIADYQITAKNVLNNDYANYKPALARLNSIGSWCGKNNTVTTHIHVDFDQTVDIYGLIVQGRYGSDEHVTSFALAYTENGEISTYTFMMDSNSEKKYITEMMPEGQYVIVSVQNEVHKMIRSKSIHIEPLSWSGDNPCMRFELLSCN